MKISLKTKFVFAIIVVEIIMLSIMVLNNLRLVKESNYRRVKTRINIIMELFSMQVTRGLIEDYLVQEHTDFFAREQEGGIAYAAVEDSNGRFIAHTDKTKIGSIANINEERSLEETKDGVYDVSMPVIIYNRFLGRIRLGFSTTQLEKDIATARNQGILIALIQLCLGIIVALLLGWYLTRHLARLTFSVKEVAAGKFYQEVEYAPGDEIGVLGAAFNKMALKLQNIYHNLEEKIIELKSLDTLKDDFLNTVSHDLSTPIATVMGYVSILERKEVGDLNPNQTKYLKAVKNACKYLAFLVENLLTTARIEASYKMETQATFSLNDLIKEIQELFNPQMSEKQISLSVLIPYDFIVKGERGALKQVFANLISNAIKFTPVGGSIKIEVKEIDKTTIEVSVIDSGKGISQDKIPTLFNKFTRYGDEKGMGLGLYISQKIITAHGSKIILSSEIDKGTKITFNLYII